MRKLEAPNSHGIYSAKTACLLKPDYKVIGKIALVDADLLDNGTRHPNLAIMKLSGYFKERGCSVRLIESYDELVFMGSYYPADNFDAIFISKVFDYTKIDSGLLELDHVYFGGTGFFFDHSPALPDEIEHHMPDYHIYDDLIAHDTKHLRQPTYWKDYQDYSIGFATRGCFRQCEFCVNHGVKRVEFHSHINEWLDNDRKGIYLWDDNIFGASCWREVFEELEATGKPYKFRQGLDIRLMTDDRAKLLHDSHYMDDFIFAFDHLDEAEIIENKLQLWRKYTDRPTKLYVLAGFESQDEKEIESVFKRIEILIRYGCLPYIMRHENYEKSPYKGMFIQIARWCNQPQFLKKLSFRQYIHQCQSYHKTKGTLCAPMKAMTKFESQFPEIAEKYFDMEYLKQPYVIKRMERKAELRKKKGTEKVNTNYVDSILSRSNNQEILYNFYLRPINYEKIKEYDSDTLSNVAMYLLSLLLITPIETIIDIICAHKEEIPVITTRDIPMFSNLKIVDNIPGIAQANPGASFPLIGKILNPNTRYENQRKWAEEHYRLAAMMCLVENGTKAKVTFLGKEFAKLALPTTGAENMGKRDVLRPRLCLCSPCVQVIVSNARDSVFNAMDFYRSLLTEQTAIRRRSCTKQMLNEIYQAMQNGSELRENVIWR